MYQAVRSVPFGCNVRSSLRGLAASLILIQILPVCDVVYSTCTQAQTSGDLETYDFSMSKGLIEFGRKRYEQAAALFRQAADAKPNDFDAQDYLGQTLLRLRQYEAAETIFQKLVDVDPSSGRALLGLGIARSHLGKYDEALANLKAAERALPDNPLVYYYQGLVYHQLRAFDLSPALFSRAMALGPDLTPSARYYTGIAHYRRGLIDEAQREFEAAIASGEPESELARSAKEFLEHRGAPPKGPRRWDLSLSVSQQYDSNVVLLPLGTQPPGGQTGISQKDDYRTALYLRGEFRPVQTNAWTAGATYGFYQSFHRTLSAFDVEDHSPSAFVQQQIGSMYARLQYVFDYVKVGRAPYLIAHAIQPTVTFSEGGNKFTQFQFRYQNKDFQHGRFLGNSARDGKNWLAGVTQYIFFANGTGNVRIGYVYDTDRTGGGSPAMAVPGEQSGADWAYQGHRVSAGLGLPPVMAVTTSLAFDYYKQQYENPNSFSPTGSERRNDDILFVTATLSRDIGKSFTVAVEYNYTRDQSNIRVFDYARNIFSLTLSGRF